VDRRPAQCLRRREHIIVFGLHPHVAAVQHLDSHGDAIELHRQLMARQRRTPAVVLCRNNSAVTASANASGAITSTRKPCRPFFICTGQVWTSNAPALTSACRKGSTYSGLMSSTSVASSTTRPASLAASA